MNELEKMISAMAEEIKALLPFKNLIKTNSDIKCDYLDITYSNDKFFEKHYFNSYIIYTKLIYLKEHGVFGDFDSTKFAEKINKKLGTRFRKIDINHLVRLNPKQCTVRYYLYK